MRVVTLVGLDGVRVASTSQASLQLWHCATARAEGQRVIPKQGWAIPPSHPWGGQQKGAHGHAGVGSPAP